MLGRFFEEIEVGLEFALGEYRFTRERIVSFARAFDPQPFHLEDDAAARGPFGRLTASGWHTAAAWMRCYVDNNLGCESERASRGLPSVPAGPSPGLTNLSWRRPVFVDDTISFFSRITGKRPLQSRPAWGLVTMEAWGSNATGERVFEFEDKVFTARRPA